MTSTLIKRDYTPVQRPEPEAETAVHCPTVFYEIVHGIPGRVRFRIPKLSTDPAYTKRLEALIRSIPGVTQVRLNRYAACVAIAYSLQNRSDLEIRCLLINAIQTARISLTPLPEPPPKTPESASTPEWFVSEIQTPALATLLAILGESLGLPIPRPLIATSVIVASLPVMQRAITSLRQDHRLNIDCLDAIAVTCSGLQGRWLTTALLLLLHEVGDWIRDQTARTSAVQAADLLSTLGHFAWVERQGEKYQIPVSEVQPGDTVVVYPGEMIPVDGQVLRGKASIDQQKLTGEAMPVVRSLGETVYASTLVRSGELYVKAERVGNATRAGASLELVKQAPVHDTRMENYAAQIADQAVIPALLLAGVVGAITRNPSRMASILTLDFVTGIRVSIPTTFLAGLNHATQHGVLIRSGRALEQLAKVDTIVFDKTGTLTQGNLQVVGVETVTDRMTPKRVLQLAASAEQRLTHPLAEAVMDYAATQNLEILPRRNWDFVVGLGVKAEVDGETVLVGSDRFLRQNGISVDCFYERHPCLVGQCHNSHPDCPISAHASIMYVASQGEFQGVIQYADPLRSESQQVIEQLQHQGGIEIHLLTGDQQQRAIAVGQALGIPLSQVHAEAFPEDKAAIVKQLHEAGKTVAFVGDGLNDSVALVYADVSVSFGEGSEVARETADVVLMNDDLIGLLDAIAIAKETKQIIDQNIGISVIPNLAALGLASTLGLHPLIATVIHNGSAILAGLNGLRPLIHRHHSQS